MRSIRWVAAVAGIATASVAGAQVIDLSTWPVTKIDSRKAPDAQLSLRRIFVVTDILDTEGLDAFLMEKGGRSAARFELEKAVEVRLGLQLRRCGVELAGYALGGLDLEEDVARARAVFGPDAVLVVRRMDAAFDDGAPRQELWDVALQSPPAAGARVGKEWWRADVLFPADDRGSRRASRTARSAERFVDELVDRMKADGLFPGCAREFPDELPSIGAAVPSSGFVASSALRVRGAVTIAAFTFPAARAAARAAESEASRQRGDGSATAVELPPSGPSLEQLGGPIWGAGRTPFAPSLEAYFQAAIGAELARMGIATNDPRRVLTGEIEDATADYSRWGFGCTVRVRFELKDASTGQVLYSASKTGSTAARASSEAQALDQALRTSAEALAQDPEFVRAIQ